MKVSTIFFLNLKATFLKFENRKSILIRFNIECILKANEIFRFKKFFFFWFYVTRDLILKLAEMKISDGINTNFVW